MPLARVGSALFTLFARLAWVGFFSYSSFVRKWRRTALIDIREKPIAWQYHWLASQWHSGPAAGRRRGEAQSGQGGGIVEWRTAGLVRPGGSEPRGPGGQSRGEGTVPEAGPPCR
ncbi:hypothetical protein AV530_004481 [Patagioenas fasciata monilis]|uniref:Uncharacterized protein n=1 Tax=Patagioenas fasciata monilis TaxID=372326 RepID=A0A1V4JCT8_PATFA|nr:hypothetical protein AV530_004481 [Patagioenas fasciata monilis]